MSKEITPKKILNIISSTSNLTNEEKHELRDMQTIKIDKEKLKEAIENTTDFNSYSVCVPYEYNSENPQTIDGCLESNITNDMLIGNHHSIRFFLRVDSTNFCRDYTSFNFSDYTDEVGWVRTDDYNNTCDQGKEIHTDSTYLKYDSELEIYVPVDEEEENELHSTALDNHNDYLNDYVDEISIDGIDYKIIYT